MKRWILNYFGVSYAPIATMSVDAHTRGEALAVGENILFETMRDDMKDIRQVTISESRKVAFE